MSGQSKRITAMVISGVLVISMAIAARKFVSARRAAAIKAGSPVADQAAAEQEMVKLHDAARANPHDRKAQWDLANFYLKYNIIDKAADQLASMISTDHSDVDAELKLAGICLASGQYQIAESYFRDATTQSPKSILAWQGLCATLIKESRYFEASTAGASALKLDKNDNGSQLLHATATLDFVMQFADPLSHLKELLTAHAELMNLSKSMPDNADVFYNYGRSEMGLIHRKEAIKQFERARQLAPKNADVPQLLALTYRFVLRDDKALKVLQEAAVAQPDNPGINDMLGRLLLDSTEPGAHERALEAFKKAVKGAPYDSKFNEHLGAAFDKLKDYKSARLAYERATQLNPYRSTPFQKLALLYTRIGEPKLAKQAATLAVHAEFNEQQLVRLTELSGKHPDDVNLHLIIADRYKDMKMSSQARDEYFVALKLDPKNKRIPKEFLAETTSMPNPAHL